MMTIIIELDVNRKCANNAKLLKEERRRFTLFVRKTKDTNKGKDVPRMFMEFKLMEFYLFRMKTLENHFDNIYL